MARQAEGSKHVHISWMSSSHNGKMTLLSLLIFVVAVCCIFPIYFVPTAVWSEPRKTSVEQSMLLGQHVQLLPDALLHGCNHSKPDYRVEHCLDYLRNNQSDYLKTVVLRNVTCSKEKTVLFHVLYSRSGLHILRLHVMSFLATQRLECCVLTLWTYVPIGDELDTSRKLAKREIADLMEAFPENIRMSTWLHTAPASSAGRSPAWLTRVFSMCARYLASDETALSDMARLAILSQYGGTYVDVDSIYLRDTQALWALEYAYHWSMLPPTVHNNAVLSLQKHGWTARALLDEGANSHCWFGPQKFAHSLVKHAATQNGADNAAVLFPDGSRREILLNFPLALFDFLWLDGAKDNISALPELHDFNDLWNAVQVSDWTDRLAYFFNRSFILHYHDSRAVKDMHANSYM